MKKILAVLLTLTALLSLASCGDEPAETTSFVSSESEVSSVASPSEESKPEGETVTDPAVLPGKWEGDWDCTEFLNGNSAVQSLGVTLENVTVAMRFQFEEDNVARLYATTDALEAFADNVIGQLEAALRPQLEEIAEATGVSFDTVCRDELGTSFDKYFENLREEMGLETMFPKKKDKDAAGKFELIDGNRLYTFGKKGTRADAGGYFEIAVTGDTLTLEKYVGDNGPSFTFPAVMKKI